MSYTIDVYRNEAGIQKNPLGLATYITLFPQLVAGPIVRYRTIAEEINERTHSFDLFAYGVRRFVIGLAKKVLIANQLGELYQLSVSAQSSSVLFYWMAAIAFSLQIYFDFSGYSDMAIGLGRIFGFHFLENFNYPYISKSISEFWRRWHISLGTWFKDYLYIPLGGNRGSNLSWFRNIIIVWFLTGFWHGANWNFIIWGLYFGLILVVEKLFLNQVLVKLPHWLRHVYVCLIVVISFVIFNNEDLAVINLSLKGMFGQLPIPIFNAESIYYLRSYAIIIGISIIGATPFARDLIHRGLQSKTTEKIINGLEPIFLLSLLLLVTGYLVDSSFNPFLYFRF
jgi:alginate O-acetyltransferase complex protein AlgI